MGKNRRAFKYSQTGPHESAPPDWRKMSPTKLEKIRQATELQIDEFMKKVGYANPAQRTDEEGWRWFELGSARGRAGIVESSSGGEMFLRAESLVRELPTDEKELLPLMRELLEANMTIAGAARLGISGEGVFVCATVPIVELVPGDVPAHIHSVMAIAESVTGHIEPDGSPDLAPSSSEGAISEKMSQEQIPAESVAPPVLQEPVASKASA